MSLNKRKELLKYLISDLVSAVIAWVSFYIFRKTYIEPLKFGETISITFNNQLIVGLILIPLFWVVFYYLSGYYQDPFRKSRLNEFGITFIQSLIGVLILFFIVILDDEIASYQSYYISFLALFGLHFFLTFLLRYFLISSTVHKIHRREIGYNTLIVGSNENAIKLYQELENAKVSSGFKILGFVHVNGNKGHGLKDHLHHLGHINEVSAIIKVKEVEEVIIAIEPSEHHKIVQKLVYKPRKGTCT